MCLVKVERQCVVSSGWLEERVAVVVVETTWASMHGR